MELLDNVLWWNSNRGDEKSCARLNDDVSKLVELSLGVIIAVERYQYSCFSVFPT